MSAPQELRLERIGWAVAAGGAAVGAVSSITVDLPYLAFPLLVIALWLLLTSGRTVREARAAGARAPSDADRPAWLSAIPGQLAAVAAGLLAIPASFAAVYLAQTATQVRVNRLAPAGASDVEAMLATTVVLFAAPTVVVVASWFVLDRLLGARFARSPWTAGVAQLAATIAGYAPMLVWLGIAAPLGSPVLAILAPAALVVIVVLLGLRLRSRTGGTRGGTAAPRAEG